MKNNLARKIVLLVTGIIISLTAYGETEHEYLFKVGQFDKLKVLDNVNVVYKVNPDSTGYLAYRGEKDFSDAFIYSNSNGELKIQVTTEDVGKPNLPTIIVYSDFLSYAENSGSKELRIEAPAPCSKFKVNVIGNGSLIVQNLRATEVKASIISGSGKIFLSGNCQDAMFKVVGTGSITADRLKSATVTCTESLGTGYIGCWATDYLRVRGLGSTSIYYKGEPTIKKTGNGKIYSLPEEPSENKSFMAEGQPEEEGSTIGAEEQGDEKKDEIKTDEIKEEEKNAAQDKGEEGLLPSQEKEEEELLPSQDIEEEELLPSQDIEEEEEEEDEA